MAIFYLDASAVVKFYIPEPGTETMKELIEGAGDDDRLYTSLLSSLEVSSAIFRKTLGNQISQESAFRFLNWFEQDSVGIFQFWPLTPESLSDAISVVQQYRLRTGDAIHMATALRIASVEPDVVMVSSDRELVEASESANITSLDPQSQDSVQRLNAIRNTV